MTEESKPITPKSDNEIAKDVLDHAIDGISDDVDDVEPNDPSNPDAVASTSAAKKLKSKRAKLKKALGVGSSEDGEASKSSNSTGKLTSDMVEQLLELNPSLKSEVKGMNKEKAAEAIRKLDVADLLTGLVCSVFLSVRKEIQG